MYRMPGFLKLLVGSLFAIATLTGLLFLQNPASKINEVSLPEPLEQISTTPSVKQINNLLVEITDSKQQFVVGAILLNFQHKSVIAPLDSNIVLDLRSFGLRDLHSAANQVSSAQLVQALSVASGLAIDGVLNLTQIGLGALLDDRGGVTVQVPDAIKLPKASDDEPKLLVAGQNKLDGSTGAAYAVYRKKGESAVEQSSRFLPVLSAALDSLPKDAQAINSRLASLGQSGSSNLTDLDVANYLARTVGSWEDAQQIRLGTEPSQLRTPTKPNWLLLNPGAVYSQIIQVQPEAKWFPVDASMRMSVSSRDPKDRLLVRKLISRGDVYFVDGGSTSPSLRSHLLVVDSVPKSVVVKLKEKLKLPDLAVQTVSQISTGTDMQLDLGTDFSENQSGGGN